MDLIIESPRSLVARPVSRPPALSTGEVLVEVNRISLCGSDYRLYDGSYGGPKSYPIRFGHEWAGRIVETGRSSRFSPGDRVTGDCSKWCGGCQWCQSDKNLCDRIEKFGITVDGFSLPLRAVQEKYLYADQFGLDNKLLALVELFAVARRGIRAAESSLRRDTPVLVIGAGAVGLATQLILKHDLRLENVVIQEASPNKTASVADRVPDCQFTAGWTVDNWNRSFTYAEIVAAAKYPVVFECAGGTSALNSALLQCRMGGLMICFGLSAVSAIRTDLIVTKRLTLCGSIGGTGEFDAAMQFLAAHGDSVRALVTHEYPITQAGAAFEQTISCAERIKTQLLF